MAWLVLVLVLVILVEWYDVGRIPGIPVVRGWPWIQQLLAVAHHPLATYSRWSRRHGDVFQLRLGRQRVVVANLYAAVRALWIASSCANNLRPVLHTFHTVVLAQQGPTVGLTPAGPSYRVRKKTVGAVLNLTGVQQHTALLDAALARVVRAAAAACGRDTDLFHAAQMAVLRILVWIAYGRELETEDTDAALAAEIVAVENALINLRTLAANWADYLPALRLWPGGTPTSRRAEHWRRRRDAYMEALMSDFHTRVQGVPRSQWAAASGNCLVATADIGASDLKSVCLTMMSAGLDNTPLCLTHTLGWLAMPGVGAQTQARMVAALRTTHGLLQAAWHECVQGTRCDYVVAVLNELLRMFTVLPLALPRATTLLIVYRGSVIPAGTMMVMNAYSANHDAARFPRPYAFSPERFLDEHGKMAFREGEGTLHYAFGAGLRGCSGKHLAFREMYAMLVRLVVAFHIQPAADPRARMHPDPFHQNSNPKAALFEPRPFGYRFTARRGGYMPLQPETTPRCTPRSGQRHASGYSAEA